MGPLGTAMRVRVLHAKLYAYALPGSTARQLFISSTLLDSSTARQLLDRPRQTSTEPPLTACDGASRCQARQLDSSTDLDRPRQTNDRPRQSRPDTDQPIRMPPPFRCQKEQLACPCGGAIHERHCSFGLFVRALFDLNLLRIALRLHFLVLKPVAR